MPTLYTAEEAAEQLRCHRRHIYHLVKSGQLSHIAHGGRYLFRPEHISEYLDRQEVKA